MRNIWRWLTHPVASLVLVTGAWLVAMLASPLPMLEMEATVAVKTFMAMLIIAVAAVGILGCFEVKEAAFDQLFHVQNYMFWLVVIAAIRWTFILGLVIWFSLDPAISLQIMAIVTLMIAIFFTAAVEMSLRHLLESRPAAELELVE